MNSDFEIVTNKNLVKKPLALEHGYALELNYWDGLKWNNEISKKVPYKDDSEMIKRILPGTMNQYPYLTVDDFLEEYLIKLPYEINEDKFFGGKEYLLPIKNKFFEFFDIDYLMDESTDRTPNIQFLPSGRNSIKVELRIPIQNNRYITFQRMYKPVTLQERPNVDKTNNEGVIYDYTFNIAVSPFIKIKGSNISPDYRILLIDRELKKKKATINLQFSKEEEPTINVPLDFKTDVRNRGSKVSNNAYSADIYVLRNSFDLVTTVIHDGDRFIRGLLIPKMKIIEDFYGAYIFSVDFGTTSTNIEYKLVGSPNFQELSYDEDEYYLGSLIKGNEDYTFAPEVKDLFSKFFLPLTLGSDYEFSFPLRTVIYSKKGFNPDNYFSIADLNIPFAYEKYGLDYKDSIISTKLKWDNFVSDKTVKEKVRAFLENIILMMRNKILITGGNISDTILIWFYPISMPVKRLDELKKIWSDIFSRYISHETNRIQIIPESLAPFYYFYREHTIDMGTSPVISIDIGGGTTDITIFNEDGPELISSFKFGGNSIFGDGFNSNINLNGFVKRFSHDIENSLAKSNLDLLNVCKTIRNITKSEELISFFFSLEKNYNLKKNNVNIVFSEVLQTGEDKFKIIYLLFCSSIIYHIAKILKFTNPVIPHYITFSGNGSKILNLLTPKSPNSTTLIKLTEEIFKNVFQITDVKQNIQIIQIDEPKKATTKGGLYFDDPLIKNLIKGKDYEVIKNSLIISDSENPVFGKKLTYDTLDQSVFERVSNDVDEFFDTLITINKKINFNNYFGVKFDLDKIRKKYFSKDSNISHIKQGLEITKLDLGGNLNVALDEPLFFYPFVGALNKLAWDISNDKVD